MKKKKKIEQISGIAKNRLNDFLGLQNRFYTDEIKKKRRKKILFTKNKVRKKNDFNTRLNFSFDDAGKNKRKFKINNKIRRNLRMRN